MADGIEKKIDSYLKKGNKNISVSSKSYVPLRKLMNVEWNENEDHLRGIALECIAEIMENNDELGNEFLKRLHKEAKTIGEAIIKQYATNFDVDMLPPRG